jgi:hypothetical protein
VSIAVTKARLQQKWAKRERLDGQEEEARGVVSCVVASCLFEIKVIM